MGVLKSVLLIVYFVPFGLVCGQFRLVGLLNVDGDSKAAKHQTTMYQTNAQGRGFSIDDGLKKFLIRPKDIIRVHVIGDLDEGDEMSNTDSIFMFQPVKIPNEKPKKIQRTTTTTETTVANNVTIAIKRKPTKPGKCRKKHAQLFYCSHSCHILSGSFFPMIHRLDSFSECS